jgi:D-glycero-alpha-D-manno-heptose-7-phosphate kinase
MIITRTPYRVSFFGGGTDYPGWYRNNNGAVLATTIDKYCYITCRRLPQFFEHKHRIVYSKIENVSSNDEIQHPAVRAALNWMNVEDGLEIHHDGDLPARSGLGSSSSFCVGLVHALRALNGQMSNKDMLAKDAIHIEQNLLQEAVGSQDQVSAAFGGLNRIDFRRDDSFDVQPVIVSNDRKQQLSDHLMLFFTGVSRLASEVARSQLENMSAREAQLRLMQDMVDEALSILVDPSQPIERFGQMLHESWMHKRSLSAQVSNASIDQLYEQAMSAGALGGKILGAGGGGFMLFFARPEDQPRIREALANLVHVPFDFEDSGSRIVLYQPDGL